MQIQAFGAVGLQVSQWGVQEDMILERGEVRRFKPYGSFHRTGIQMSFRENTAHQGVWVIKKRCVLKKMIH